MKTLKDAPTTLMFHAEMLPPIADSVGDAVIQSGPPLQPHGELNSYETFLESRPPAFETYAVDKILSLAPTAPQLHLHIVHLSATECIPMLRQARQNGIHITAETCFHYLGLASDDIQDGDTRHKCCPPIRSQTNQDRLWDEICDPDGCIKTIVSDHSPCTPELKLLPPHLQTVYQEGSRPTMQHLDSGIDVTLPKEGKTEVMNVDVNTTAVTTTVVADITPAAPTATLPAMHPDDSGIDVRLPSQSARASPDSTASIPIDQSAAPPTTQTHSQEIKQGDFFAAWGGISSVGLGLPILYTTSALRASRGLSAPSILDIVRMCSQATAQQVGLSHCKGGLRAGLDADIAVFDDEEVWTLRAGDMRWKNRCSPWEGHTFRGRVKETWVRGRRVFALDGGDYGSGNGFGEEGPWGRAIVERRTA